MPTFKITAPDGTTYRVTAPEGATEEEALAKVQAQYSAKDESILKGRDEPTIIGDIAAGALRGAGSIGATILAPIDAAARALNKGQPVNIGGYDIAGQDRRQAMDEALKTMGANPESLAFKTGKIASELAGTAGVGGALAKGASALGAAPGVVNALQTAGMAGPNMLTRMGAGATVGGAAAGLVNPEDAALGAGIGAAVPVAGAVLKGAATIGRKVLGGTTGVGDEALRQAYLSGKAGGPTAKAFTENMRGASQMDDVLAAAKQNLEVMGAEKQAAYRAGMANIKADKSVLDLSNIAKSADDAMKMATYKGQVKNESAANALQAIKGEIDNWRSLDPAEFHTPEGLDALKQKIGGILESIPYEQKTARAAAGNVYNSIKKEITTQAPEYSKVMKGYSEASQTINEIERALSLGNKASAETSMRKLQSLMRNNVNTSYGYRTDLARTLEQAGGHDLMPSLAGQALSEAMPRGLQKVASGAGGVGLAMTGNIPAALGLGVVSSPRVMGEVFYGAGKASNALSPAVKNALLQQLYRGAPIAGVER